MDLVRLWAFSPMGPLQPDRSTLVCTPVTSARTQLNSIPRFLLAWSEATHSSSATNSAHVSLTFAFAASRPCAWNFGVSFFSISSRDTSDFLESFFTHLIGFRECPPCDDVSFAAVDAPAPAGPCAAARPAPMVRLRDKIKTTMTARKQCLFIFTPLVNPSRFNLRLPDLTSTSVGHSIFVANTHPRTVRPQLVTLAVRTGHAFADKGGASEEINYSRFEAQVKSVKSQAEAPEDEQRQQVVGHRGENLHGNPQRRTVSGGEVIHHGPEQHVQQTAAYLLATVGSRTARQLHLRNGLAAKRALGQMRGHVLSAVDASACFHRALS